jgi:hypothetical protein
LMGSCHGESLQPQVMFLGLGSHASPGFFH